MRRLTPDRPLATVDLTDSRSGGDMDVRISLLGGFSITVDGDEVPPAAWGRRHAAALVKLLALASGRRMLREQVLDALWPDVPPEQAGPRLHKAAHYARRALGGDEALTVVLRNDVIELFPGSTFTIDVDDFRERAERALASGSREEAMAALSLHRGPLLPDDVYEPWTEQRRDSIEMLHHRLLRLTESWEEILAHDPLDEEAHLALARGHAEQGDVRAALRQLERLEQAVRTELGTAPGPEAQRLRTQLLGRLPSGAGDGSSAPRRRLVGRRPEADAIRALLARAAEGRGGALLVSGPPGVGKSALLDLSVSLATRAGWRTARGTAAAIEGSWPYAPVLEALGDLCRRHPALLDGLDDRYRDELDRALSGRDVVWSGESAHQRLFVAAAELVRLAAAGHGLLLVVDDTHEADEASLRLLHYLARCAVTEHVVLVLAHRAVPDAAVGAVHDSLVARGIGTTIELSPLPEATTLRLLADAFPGLDDRARMHVSAVSRGLPFAALELGRAASTGRDTSPLAGLPAEVTRTLARVALLGTSFTTDELLAVAGTGDEAAYRHLELAQQTLLVERSDGGFRFRHTLLRDAVLATLEPQGERAARRDVARRLAEMGAPPARIAHQYLAAGAPVDAIPHVLPAVETAGALGAYRDALALVDAVVDHAEGPVLGHLLARRGDLLMALGDPKSMEAYRRAVALTTGVEHRLVRARLARGAAFAGDLDTARSALAGLELEGDAADGPILLARGNVSYFSGDVEAAWDAATQARESLLAPEDPWHFVDLVGLQGLIAHQRGEWFERFRLELRRTAGNDRLVTALFDAHLCVAEYLLYGPVPYVEVIELARDLRSRAERFGALRGVAFATALIGEAALLMGDLVLAEDQLVEAVDLHREADATAGEAHTLERLAELRLAQGDRESALRLLQQALPLARWSVMGRHVLQRINGSMVRAAADPEAARAMVDRGAATLAETDSCLLCDIMFAIPAAIACADVGDVLEAERHLATAQSSAAHWEGTAWPAAVLEARGHVARARGETDRAVTLLSEASRLFDLAGQPLDAARCASDLLVAGP